MLLSPSYSSARVGSSSIAHLGSTFSSVSSRALLLKIGNSMASPCSSVASIEDEYEEYDPNEGVEAEASAQNKEVAAEANG